MLPATPMLQQSKRDSHIQRQQQEYPNNISQAYLRNFMTEARHRWLRLKQSVLGNYEYQPVNDFSFQKKQKIFQYLKSKYIQALCSAEEERRRSLFNYDKDIGVSIEFKSLSSMKDALSRLRSHLEAAKETKMQLEASSRNLKGIFFNELAYEFDRQRYSSIGWGLVLGAFICSTIYRRGSIARKTALFLTCGHLCGQLSYHINLDKYFDTIYPVFQEDALEYTRKEKLEDEANHKSDFAGILEN